MNYWLSKGIRKGGLPPNTDVYAWNHSSVEKILIRQEYCGDIINFKSYTRVFRQKKSKKTPDSERMVFENVHEPIVSREDFERVQELRKRGIKHRESKTGKNIFSGLLRCFDCGGTLSFHINPKNDDITYYNCNNNNKVRKTCESTHYVRSDFLAEVVLADIRRVTAFSKADEKAFVQLLMESVGATNKQAEDALKAQLSRIQTRLDELELLFRRIYEDSALGDLSRDHMVRLSKSYEDEQIELKQQEDRVRQELASIAERDTGVKSFTAVVKKHARIRRLTPAILHQFIDHIDVHQAKKKQGTWSQQIDIYYNCVGKIDVPVTSKTKQKEIAMHTREGVVLQLADEVKVRKVS